MKLLFFSVFDYDQAVVSEIPDLMHSFIWNVVYNSSFTTNVKYGLHLHGEHVLTASNDWRPLVFIVLKHMGELRNSFGQMFGIVFKSHKHFLWFYFSQRKGLCRNMEEAQLHSNAIQTKICSVSKVISSARYARYVVINA